MSDKSKYTPGPWEARRYCVWGPDAEYVAGTKTGISDETQEANATLIAAAPESHEANIAALKYLIEDCAGGTPGNEHLLYETIRRLRAAIAKAKGK